MAEYLIQKETLDAIAQQCQILEGFTTSMNTSDMINTLTQVNHMCNSQSEYLDTIEYLISDKFMPLDRQLIEKSIQHVSALDTVLYIGDYAFYSCYKLTSIIFPNVTSIGNYAFKMCQGLTSIDFPNTTSVGNSAFGSCHALSSISLPSVVTLDKQSFYDCIVLKSVYFPNVTHIGTNAFTNCKNLVSADFQNVTSIDASAFQWCNKLKTLILRTTTQACNLINSNALNNTGISTSDGCIYVPEILIDSYKNATNWSVYANKFRALEEYEEVV